MPGCEELAVDLAECCQCGAAVFLGYRAVVRVKVVATVMLHVSLPAGIA
jgi:hypothetical protein